MTENSLAIVDPRKVVIDDNVRKNVNDADLAELTESIRTLGLLQLPTVTVAADGKYHLVIGQRRVLASIAAGLRGIRVHVVDEHTAAGARLIDQIAENEQRSNLTEVDLMRGYKELALLGYSVEEIETRTRKPRARIEAAIAIGDNEAATALVQEKNIDLLHAAAIAEFDGDKKAVAKLTDKAQNRPEQFEYALREVRRDASLTASKKAIAAQLKDAGVPVIKDTELGHNRKGAELTDLNTDKGANLTLSNHKKCPGHSAVIWAGWNDDEAKIKYCCSDWEANGHQKKHRGHVESDEARAAREKREEDAAEARRAVEISRELRLEFTAGILLRNKPATLKGSDMLIALTSNGSMAEMLDRQLWLGDVAIHTLSLLAGPESTRDDALELITTWLTNGTAPAAQITIATALAKLELFARTTYSSNTARAARKLYFTTLATWGHTLSDHEQSILAQIAEREAEILAEQEAEAAAALAEDTTSPDVADTAVDEEPPDPTDVEVNAPESFTPETAAAEKADD